MITTKISHLSSNLAKVLVVSALVLAGSVFVTGAVAVHAQTTTYTSSTNGAMYSIPAGYTTYNSNGVYYDSETGMYYDAVTGQYSSTVPSGAASVNPGGTYNIPVGYTNSVYGTYYSPTTGMYYDPATGFYSSTAPAGPMYASGSLIPSTTVAPTTVITNPIPVYNPGVPNTGAGGDAGQTIAFLALAGAIALGGGVFIGMRAFSKAS